MRYLGGVQGRSAAWRAMMCMAGSHLPPGLLLATRPRQRDCPARTTSFASPRASVWKAATEICIAENLLLESDPFEKDVVMETRAEKFHLSVAIAGNVIIVGWCFLVSLPILLGQRVEVLTGESYAWPLSVLLVSLFVLSLSLILLAATFQAWKRRQFFKATAACLAVLAVIELLETVMLHILYGPLQLDNVSVYINGPLFIAWAALNVMLYKPKNGVTAER